MKRKKEMRIIPKRSVGEIVLTEIEIAIEIVEEIETRVLILIAMIVVIIVQFEEEVKLHWLKCWYWMMWIQDLSIELNQDVGI